MASPTPLTPGPDAPPTTVRVEVVRAVPAAASGILTPEALEFVATLVRTFRPRLERLLDARRTRQARIDAGALPEFLPETADVREGSWRVAPLPLELADRRVEITGPVDRKMIINALNSGASVFMADFEDASSPTWENMVVGQANVRDAVARTITFTAPEGGRTYRLVERPAVLFVRPRGLHLSERHLRVDGARVPAALFDFGLFFFHNARALTARGSAPYLYLPKLESHLEARWWNDVFVHAERALGLAVGTIKATVLIETLHAAFEMDEILYELRDHSAGLNCGRWDYIFSVIKTFRAWPQRVLPDRSQLTMTQPFLRAYTQLLIRTCHRRGAHAMGGMAAQIPIKGDDERNRAALEKVTSDKEREVRDGHDGTWVAHPGLVPVARAIFDQHMAGANQISRLREDVVASQADLLAAPAGTRTLEGVRHNVRVGVQYLEAWLRGQGCVPLYDLMEDAATAEISRAQVWHWVRYAAHLEDGTPATADLVSRVMDEELARVRREIGDDRFATGKFVEARRLFLELSTAEELADFLTLPAYEKLTENEEN